MSLKHLASGKVREIYEIDDDALLVVTTDRISAFDVIMEETIPDRGRVLTALTHFWLTNVAKGMPHHLVSVDVPSDARELVDVTGRAMVVRKAQMLPVEFIVRGYLAGTGWNEYRETHTLHGRPLPSGLQLGSALPEPVLTPSTKGEIGEHDVNLTWNEAAEIVGFEVMKRAEALALEMYHRGAEWTLARGLVLADTKFELGYIDGELSLCDEILTPDSSRYWPSTGWELGQSPPAFDKQVLRDWLETLDWDKRPPPPHLPGDVIAGTRERYVQAYERITGMPLANWPGVTTSTSQRPNESTVGG